MRVGGVGEMARVAKRKKMEPTALEDLKDAYDNPVAYFHSPRLVINVE